MGPAERWSTWSREARPLSPDNQPETFAGSVSSLTLKRTTCSIICDDDDDDILIQKLDGEGGE